MGVIRKIGKGALWLTPWSAVRRGIWPYEMGMAGAISRSSISSILRTLSGFRRWDPEADGVDMSDWEQARVALGVEPGAEEQRIFVLRLRSVVCIPPLLWVAFYYLASAAGWQLSWVSLAPLSLGHISEALHFAVFCSSFAAAWMCFVSHMYWVGILKRRQYVTFLSWLRDGPRAWRPAVHSPAVPVIDLKKTWGPE